MCLAVPGMIVEMADDRAGGVAPLGTVDFQGTRIEASLAMTPGVRVGDWVLVHAGFAIARLDEDEARATWDYLRAADAAEGRDGPPLAGRDVP